MASGLLGAFLYSRLTRKVETEGPAVKRAGLSPKSRPVVYPPSAPFPLAPLGGGLIRLKLPSPPFSEPSRPDPPPPGARFLGARTA